MAWYGRRRRPRRFGSSSEALGEAVPAWRRRPTPAQGYRTGPRWWRRSTSSAISRSLCGGRSAVCAELTAPGYNPDIFTDFIAPGAVRTAPQAGSWPRLLFATALSLALQRGEGCCCKVVLRRSASGNPRSTSNGKCLIGRARQRFLPRTEELVWWACPRPAGCASNAGAGNGPVGGDKAGGQSISAGGGLRGTARRRQGLAALARPAFLAVLTTRRPDRAPGRPGRCWNAGILRSLRCLLDQTPVVKVNCSRRLLRQHCATRSGVSLLSALTSGSPTPCRRSADVIEQRAAEDRR